MCICTVIRLTCNIISVTIQAVTKSPVQVPSAATFIKFALDTPKKLDNLYRSKSEPRLRKPLKMYENMKSEMIVVKNMIIQEPWSCLNICSFIRFRSKRLWTINFPTNMPTAIPQRRIRTFNTDQPPGGYLGKNEIWLY